MRFHADVAAAQEGDGQLAHAEQRQPGQGRLFAEQAGTVRVELLRTVNGKTRVVSTVTITYTKAGTHSIKVTTRFDGHKLGKGNYTLSLQTGKGKTTSKAVKTKLNVS